MKKIKCLILSLLLICTTSSAFAYTFFSGYAGGKVNYKAINEKYDPDLTLQAFFAGQFNFTENSWGRMEFSVNTNDLLNFSIFEQSASKMNAEFQFDELSFVSRSIMANKFNYFSAYMGTYDPIGSDIFLQRYFGMEPIKSQLSDSWLGMAGSIIYPHFGAGLSDIMRFTNIPLAAGGYVYVNKDNKFILNFDGRFAGVYRFFTFDLAAGLGLPLSNKYDADDVIVVVNTLNLHAGLTMLLGNKYTNSLFIQAGCKADIDKSREIPFLISTSDLYCIVEPRFIYGEGHINITAYCLPVITIEKLLNVDDPMGIDFNIYTDTFAIKNKIYSFGWHTGFSLAVPNSNYKAFFAQTPAEIFTNFNNFNVNLTPYISTQLFNGTLHAQGKIQVMSFIKSEWFNAFSFDVGYKCKI